MPLSPTSASAREERKGKEGEGEGATIEGKKEAGGESRKKKTAPAKEDAAREEGSFGRFGNGVARLFFPFSPHEDSFPPLFASFFPFVVCLSCFPAILSLTNKLARLSICHFLSGGQHLSNIVLFV